MTPPPARTRSSINDAIPRAYPDSVRRLLEEFAKLPGIGRRSAERLVFHILKASTDDAMALAHAIEGVKTSVRYCSICFNFSDGEHCAICRDGSRDRATVLVVEQPRDLIAIEQTGMYRGVYHVLLGRLAPLEGIGPDTLTIDPLITRITTPEQNCAGIPVTEVVLGLNPSFEGDGTALYLADRLDDTGVRITRLARGLSAGRDLEYATKAALSDAIEGRRPV